MLLVLLTVLFGVIGPSLSVEFVVLIAPSSRGDWVPVLEVSKLQAPDNSQETKDLIGYGSDYFYRVLDVRHALSIFSRKLNEAQLLHPTLQHVISLLASRTLQCKMPHAKLNL